MVNYVNNSFDKVLKPCDAQQFMTLTQSEQTEKLILGHRAGEKNSKAKLPALTYMGVLDEAKYKDYLKKCEAQGTKPLGSRRAEFMRPTGLLMLDFDHVGDPSKLWETIVNRHASAAADMARAVALAHITPSGDGLRVVLKRAKGKSIEQAQHDWCELMCLDIKPDAACKDISRLSFAPMHKEILYYNPSLLFAELPEASDYPDGSIFHQSFAVNDCPPNVGGRARSAEGVLSDTSRTTSPLRGTPPNVGGESQSSTSQSSTSYPTDYNGVEYEEIIRRLEEQLGGRPEHGARNSFIFTMACNLRYVCNDDAAWIASILPTYGEDSQKHRMTIQSAVNRPMSREMPETLKRALGVAKACADNSQLTIDNSQLAAPQLPTILPEPIALLTSRTPGIMRPAVAMAVFPPLGAHLHEVTFRYWDGRDYEATFMHVLVAELSSGKSAVNTPIEYIIADMEARDDVARAKESEWKAKCATISNTKDKPERPKGLAMQVLSSDMTNAAFVQRLADAEGKFLYTQMDEVELLNALKTNTQGNTVSAILRLAFDCGKYGQERVASNAVNAKVRVRWNWNASTTIQRVRKFFAKNIADGTLSRLSFATIVKNDDDWGDMERPTFGQYGQAFADELHPYIDALCTANGTIVCPEAIEWADALSLELIGYAREIDDRTYAQLSFRAVLMGFFRAMLLYVMNACRWSQAIADFAAWSVRYDLWCKMRFFRDMLHKDLEGEKTSLQRGPVSLLTLLPDEFTKQQAQELRVAEGLKPTPNAMINQWVKRGYIVRDEARACFIKCKR